MASKRIPEIDFLRSFALFLMIIYHLIYDLDAWTTLNIDVDHLLWFCIGKTAALIFIFLSGISLGLSHHPIKNGIKTLFWGIIISFVTWIFMPEDFVRFGILHFLGAIMISYPLIKKLPNSALLSLTIFAVVLGFFFMEKEVSHPFLLPFGLIYPGFSTIDYFPLFPYSAVSFLSILFTRYAIYLQLHKLNYSPPLKNFISHPIFKKLSKNSLKIYLIHQPLLLLIILLVTYINQ